MTGATVTGATAAVDTLATMRRLLLGVLLAGLLGTGTELLLIGHDEDAWQMIPLAVLAIAVVASLAIGVRRAPPAIVMLRAFRTAMLLLVASGAAGAFLHHGASREFKLEMDPSIGGFSLFWSAVQAKAPPALAPGNMALLGLLGLTGAFRLEPRGSSPRPSRQGDVA